MASRRPRTSASGRPSTSASAFSDAPSLFYQQHQQPLPAAELHHHAIHEEQWEEDDESDEEDVFAYLPPVPGGAQPQQPHPYNAHNAEQQQHLAPPPLTGVSSLRSTDRLDTPVFSAPSISDGSFTHSLRRTASADRNIGRSLGAETFSMQPLDHQDYDKPASRDTTDSREVHVSLPSRGSRGTGAAPKRASSDFGSTVEGHFKSDVEYDVDEEDSPYPEVRASVSNIDDNTMPALTFRTWVMGLGFVVIASGANIIFNFRQPSPVIYPLVLLLVSYPIGKLMAYTLPVRVWRFPRFMRSVEFSLNPGPFNVKEHVLMYIMANVSISPAYAMNVIVVAEKYYHKELGFWFNLVLVLATQMTGFGLAGLCRRFLVWPASMIWPQNLVACTLVNTLHSEDDRWSGGVTRFRFFMFAFIASFCFFFLPGYIFSALSTFSWVCWMAPNNVIVNHLFGVESGLGLGLLTFDWSAISWIGSPLMVPWWAQLHVFGGFAFFYWILCPILYYTNAWQLSHFPMLANVPYDRFGRPYDIYSIIAPDGYLNQTAYENYSPLYLPAGWVITYWLAFSVSTSVLVHTALYHGRAMIDGIKNLRVEKDDIHAKLMRSYPEVPDWWYAIVFVWFFAMAVIAVENWHTTVPVWALVLALLVAIVYTLPGGFIFAMTGQPITLNQVSQVIAGTIMPGNAFANMIFKVYAIQTQTEAVNFIAALKLGHYIKVPPRATFIAQMVSTICACFVQVAVKTWLFRAVPDICDPKQPDSFTCPHNQVFFTASIIWGLVGPVRQFGPRSLYHPELYALLFGALVPLPLWLWQRKYPKSKLKYVSVPIILNGVSLIPPATGINYSSWFLVGSIFQYFIRRRYFAWWSKFNYVLSAALDSGTVLSILVILFTLQLPKGIEVPQWWGTTVFKHTADHAKAALRPTPEGSPLQ